ncbi:unnamed protein product [Paramecium pentaurelia]|uniref:Cyclic nucleotide-binding domain-containing protein n=1 Tax=Paramecium pentaurelia TaxID=43138 RepID=A0A8S1U1V1_9CILI|nr:unnamed protein product [Paramecium pentaurelia]
MSMGQVHPSCSSPIDTKEYKTGLDSLKLFNTIRQSRHTSKETTLIISPKHAISNRAFLTPKRSQFTSQDQIVEEDDYFRDKRTKRKFDIASRRLMILLSFFKHINQTKETDKTSQLKQIHKKRKKLPFYPNQLQIWKQFMSVQTLITLMLYPIYISLSDYSSLDILTILILILDSLYFIDIILKQITCQIDKNYNLIDTFQAIFLFNLQRWLIFDILSIIPYKLFVNNFIDQLCLNLLKLLRFVKYFSYNERQIYQETQTSKDQSQYFEKIFQLDGKLLSIIKIFKNMLILISLFGCLFHSVLQYDGISQQENSLKIYVQGLYWAIQTVTVIGYGDVPITTSTQYNLTIIWIFVGVGFYSLTIGNLAAILEQQSSNEGFDEDLEALETLMSQILIPEELSAQLFSYYYYNIENNPFWNYKKIIETLPSQLKVFAIAFCQKQLIENVNIFSFDINFAAAILPHFTIYCFKQYETIYFNGSPSLEVFFLVAGEIRLCDKDGNTLLNIQEGYIFGEIEILEDSYRKQSAIAGKDSVVIMCPVLQFLQLVQDDEKLLFEIEQLGLRRRLLLQENISRIKKNAKQIKRISALDGQLMNQYVSKKQFLERQFKRNIVKDSYQQIHKKLIRFIFGQKQEKKWKYQAIFKMAVRKIIDHRKQALLLSRKPSMVLGKQMLQNFAQVREDEKNLQKKILNNKKSGKYQKRVKIKDILNHHRQSRIAPMLITPSPYYEEIISEVKEEKQLFKQKQNLIAELSNKLIKINLTGQLKIFNTLYEELIQSIDILNDIKYQTIQSVEEMESIYYQISLLITSIF